MYPGAHVFVYALLACPKRTSRWWLLSAPPDVLLLEEGELGGGDAQRLLRVAHAQHYVLPAPVLFTAAGYAGLLKNGCATTQDWGTHWEALDVGSCFSRAAHKPSRRSTSRTVFGLLMESQKGKSKVKRAEPPV